MSDNISRADAIEAVCGDCTIERKDKCKADGYCYEVKNLMALPSADTVQGEWTYLNGSKGSYMTISCPICGSTFNDVAEWKYNYCPNCGARMKGGGE